MTTRDANRAAFPIVAGVLDQLREYFPQARVLYAAEGGKEIGQRDTGFVADGYPFQTHACAKAPRLGKMK